MKKHENKVVVITGGNSGIGYGIADELIAKGAKVVIIGKNQNVVKEAESELGANATGFVSFLISDDASFITGGDYVIDGGMSINMV